MGGGKGGADFDPKGKSNNEIMKFCQSFMTELYRHIGPNLDVPAGDIGVGGREVGFMFGQYKRIQNEFTGVLTGKGPSFGGSRMRPEATGYGNVYFAQSMLQTKGDTIKGKSIVVSGSGNVAQFSAQKATELGGKVLTMSDSGGYIYDADGIDEEKLAYIQEIKNVNFGRISDYLIKYPTAKFVAGKRPWEVKADIALPCATQNELNEEDAKVLIANGCICVAEGANMPSTPEAVSVFSKAKILFAPGKASNAGGVATSGLEMSQNSLRLAWTSEEVDEKLKRIMLDIHASCVQYGADADGHVDYVKGANIAGFVKVADAMLAQGAV
jgi:glutamate dehydrogenase (NADP+)